MDKLEKSLKDTIDNLRKVSDLINKINEEKDNLTENELNYLTEVINKIRNNIEPELNRIGSNIFELKEHENTNNR
jgi:hypothetical protein